jgi:thiamine kinase-like enzyme
LKQDIKSVKDTCKKLLKKIEELEKFHKLRVNICKKTVVTNKTLEAVKYFTSGEGKKTLRRIEEIKKKVENLQQIKEEEPEEDDDDDDEIPPLELKDDT